jgi:transcriptional/translational regulatory protein YebC/TACO1
VETWTDNLNRTSGDIRAIANKHGVKLAEPGSLSFKFVKKGQIVLRNEDEAIEDQLLLDVAEVRECRLHSYLVHMFGCVLTGKRQVEKTV